jgi:alkylhydroperoxidase family enzyme
LALARHASEAQGRASLLFTAQTWLELAERVEHEPYALSLQRHAIQMAIGDELKSLYGVSPDVPPYFLAVLARLDGETATWGHG